MKFTFSILFLLLLNSAFGQENASSNLKIAIDKLPNNQLAAIKIDSTYYQLDLGTRKRINPDWIKRVELLKEYNVEIYGNRNNTILFHPKKRFKTEILKLLENVKFCGRSITEINSLILEIGEQTLNSRDIKNHKSAKHILNCGSEIIPILLKSFNNLQETKTYSDCQGRNLTVAEIAIILTDKIELMPYAEITGIQNCTFQFCENNDNFIEYYYGWNEQNTISDFVAKYSNWFLSEERDKWNLNRAEKRNKKKY